MAVISREASRAGVVEENVHHARMHAWRMCRMPEVNNSYEQRMRNCVKPQEGEVAYCVHCGPGCFGVFPPSYVGEQVCGACRGRKGRCDLNRYKAIRARISFKRQMA